MKINKIFIVIILSIVIFAGTAFETKAINWRDYIPNVPALTTNCVNRLSLYKNRFWAFILRKESRPLTVDKAAIMGSSDYIKMLDRMQFFKEDMNRREVWEFMQKFVENYYVRMSDQEKTFIKTEYDLFNTRLKALRDNNVSWYRTYA